MLKQTGQTIAYMLHLPSLFADELPQPTGIYTFLSQWNTVAWSAKTGLSNKGLVTAR